MDYEKKYKEALERARIWKEKSGMPQNRQGILDDIFPELKESEDEKLRKALMQNLKERFGTKGNMGEGLDMPDVLAWFEKQGEQNSAWSEKDKEMIGTLVAIFEVNYPNGFYKINPIGTTNMQGIHSSEIIKWLKSLKERKQPKQEWSEDDEKCLKELTQFFENLLECIATEERHKENRRWLNWLKSLRPHSHWRPSKEQMNVLNEVINFAADHGTMRWNDYIYNVLKSLREQLKEL